MQSALLGSLFLGNLGGSFGFDGNLDSGFGDDGVGSGLFDCGRSLGFGDGCNGFGLNGSSLSVARHVGYGHRHNARRR